MISCQGSLPHSMYLPFYLFIFFPHKGQTLHGGLLNCVLLFLTQHSNLSGPLGVVILSPLVLTLPPRFVTSTPLISMPPEFSSNDKSDRIKGDLGTLQETSLKVDTQRREWNTAPPGSKEMELEQGSLHPPVGLPRAPPLCNCFHLLLLILKPASLSVFTSPGLLDDPSFYFCPILDPSDPLPFTLGNRLRVCWNLSWPSRAFSHSVRLSPSAKFRSICDFSPPPQPRSAHGL